MVVAVHLETCDALFQSSCSDPTVCRVHDHALINRLRIREGLHRGDHGRVGLRVEHANLGDELLLLWVGRLALGHGDQLGKNFLLKGLAVSPHAGLAWQRQRH